MRYAMHKVFRAIGNKQLYWSTTIKKLIQTQLHSKIITFGKTQIIIQM